MLLSVVTIYSQEISNERSAKLRRTPWDTASKGESCNDTRDSKTDTYPIRKSNRISKRRVLDEEINSLEDEDEDEEIRFLRRVKMAKSIAVEEDVDDDEEKSRKHKKLSKVMKQNVEYLRGVGTSEKSGKKDKMAKAFDDVDYVKDDDDEEEEEAVSDVEPENKRERTRRRAAGDVRSEAKTEITVTTRRRSGHSGSLIEFPRGLPPAPPRSEFEELL